MVLPGVSGVPGQHRSTANLGHGDLSPSDLLLDEGHGGSGSIQPGAAMQEDRLWEVFEVPQHPAKLALGQRGLAMIPNRNVTDLEACLPVGLQQSSRKGSLIESEVLHGEQAEDGSSALGLGLLHPRLEGFRGDRLVASEVIAGTSTGKELGWDSDADH